MQRILSKWSANLLPVILATAASAQTVEQWDSPRVHAIAQKLRCPCGCNLAMSCQMPPHPCPTCKKNRMRIYSMLAEGRSERDILDQYIREAGAEVLWVTPGLAGRTGPYVALALGFGGVLLVIRRYRRARPPFDQEGLDQC